MRYVTIPILTFFFILFFGNAFSQSSDFRNIRWGMTKIEVMATEEKRPETFAGPTLMYRTAMLGKEMFLIYGFIDNKLIDARYVFLTNNNTEYLEIRDILRKKYGNSVIARDESAMDYLYKWETPLTEIILRPGAGAECRIVYMSKKLKKFREKLEKRDAVEREKEIMRYF